MTVLGFLDKHCYTVLALW